MFESLDEQMRLDEHKSTSSKERMMRYILAGVVAVLVFGGLYLGVHLLQGT